MDSGLVAVIKSSKTTSELRSLLLLEGGEGSFGTITSIYSKGSPTSNHVVVVSRQLYDKIHDGTAPGTNPGYSDGPLGVYPGRAITIDPYIINDNHIPLPTQSTDIFLRFETTSNKEMPTTTELTDCISSSIRQLTTFNVCRIPSYEIDITPSGPHVVNPGRAITPSGPRPRWSDGPSKVGYRGRANEFGFIRFTEECPIDAAVYIKSILNGYITKEEGVRIVTYWHTL
jgi:hypothetical protein